MDLGEARDPPLGESAVDVALELLRAADRVEAGLTVREAAAARVQLYRLLLDMLDRLDRWALYLDVWAQLRQHTDQTLTYADRPGSAATQAAAGRAQVAAVRDVVCPIAMKGR